MFGFYLFYCDSVLLFKLNDQLTIYTDVQTAVLSSLGTSTQTDRHTDRHTRDTHSQEMEQLFW